ncbi:FTS and Hook-interacting protein-like isoform X2 [Gigantopelta aegis]|uniref:FTS and Hook-interacting protein-like isoform X2 n=1 Tax=Gigantopelta aegis TaxID=1735272 RepID=UPI001B887851|nr:FTS and Hook-interacting protein-like isoform X2 [Gigantopelta aegis]
MSWFKRGSIRQESRQSSSPVEQVVSRDRRDTDPDTLLEVFCNHWQQVCFVIEKNKDADNMDDIETVIHNFEQMVTFLVREDGIDGMPGPILHYLLEKDIFEKFCSWGSGNSKNCLEKLKHEQLRMFELAINQSKQVLLVHRAVIRALMKLLISCADSSVVQSSDIEHRTVLVLHQICVCISQETVILENFFNINADHGPTRFLIFSLLIPYIHREGPIGQNARDALLLLMALSAKIPHIGKYMAENSDFCPVLATGLSGLYSSLPRKITPENDSWYMLTDEDCSRIPDLHMFLNSLDFCNAVVQIAHPLVKEQLIKFIYNGFLIPVLGPALHQDIPGLPLPLLDTELFANSREEVMTATAYLDLFLRHITEPVLIKAVLKFILTEKYDEIVILDSLVTRINSSSKLSLISLSLFNTLISLNCEDVMFQLVFKYLIPCTHVMVSQRRSVKDLDLYSKSAEKFLSLRPVCCMSTSMDGPKGTSPNESTFRPSSGSRRNASTPNIRSNNVAIKSGNGLGNFFKKRTRLHRSNTVAGPPISSSPEYVIHNMGTSSSEGTRGPVDRFETSYMNYLQDARDSLVQCATACAHWSSPYNGETPPPDIFMEPVVTVNKNQSADIHSEDISIDERENKPDVKNGAENKLIQDTSSASSVKLLSHGNAAHCSSHENLAPSENDMQADSKTVNNNKQVSRNLFQDNFDKCNNLLKVKPSNTCPDLSKLYQSLNDVDSFLSYLDSVKDSDSLQTTSESIEDILQFLDSMESAVNTSSTYASSDRTDEDISQDTGMSSFVTDQSGCSSNQLTTDFTHITRPASTSTPSFLPLKSFNVSSYVNITMSGLDPHAMTAASKVLQELPQRHLSLSVLSSSPSETNLLSPSWHPDDVPLGLASPAFQMANRSFTPRYPDSAPNIGPFLSALFSKMDSMIHNSLYMNLLLTGIIARLASYPQPLLRSFLLNHNLVFQPTVKSLVQVLSSVRQKLDNYSKVVKRFDWLVVLARKNLVMKDMQESNPGLGDRTITLSSPYSTPTSRPGKSSTLSDGSVKERQRSTFSDLLFRRSPSNRKHSVGDKKLAQLQRIPVQGGMGYRFINRSDEDTQERPEESLKTWNAVYCAVVLEEFLKELAALAQEHAVLGVDEGALA